MVCSQAPAEYFMVNSFSPYEIKNWEKVTVLKTKRKLNVPNGETFRVHNIQIWEKIKGKDILTLEKEVIKDEEM